jgi:hypothetical protein
MSLAKFPGMTTKHLTLVVSLFCSLLVGACASTQDDASEQTAVARDTSESNTVTERDANGPTASSQDANGPTASSQDANGPTATNQDANDQTASNQETTNQDANDQTASKHAQRESKAAAEHEGAINLCAAYDSCDACITGQQSRGNSLGEAQTQCGLAVTGCWTTWEKPVVCGSDERSHS